MTDSALDSAREVIAQEGAGLAALADSLGDEFVAAVDLIAGLEGRVVVTGMGKSGHVARKIAATMASTGTPAYFVHPGEASHGDLGMVASTDAVIALSNSGDTSELGDIISYTKRFSIPLIAMVGKSPSALGDASDICLLLPDVAEASPVNAPTTSTTMMMALGDAIAVALLEGRGFTKDDFATFHPGGKLGKQLLRVEDLMHQGEELPVVEQTTPMQEVLLTITAKHFGCAGVVDTEGKLCGIVTDGDLRRHMESDILQKPASDVMTPSPITTTQQTFAAEALAIMNDKSITSLFVVEADKPVGILHIHDCLRAGSIEMKPEIEDLSCFIEPDGTVQKVERDGHFKIIQQWQKKHKPEGVIGDKALRSRMVDEGWVYISCPQAQEDQHATVVMFNPARVTAEAKAAFLHFFGQFEREVITHLDKSPLFSMYTNVGGGREDHEYADSARAAIAHVEKTIREIGQRDKAKRTNGNSIS